jgi:lipopolysaccharide transport system permease protein
MSDPGTQEDNMAIATDRIITYEPDNSLKKGYFFLFREIISELKESRFLIWQLFKRDFFTVYKQSFVGIFWAFLMPIVSVMSFVVLNRAGVFNTGDITVAYPIFAIIGIALWQIFATGLISCSQALAGASAMITKINVSKKSLVIAAMGKAYISFLVQFLLVGILFWFYKFVPHLKILYVPLIVIALSFFTLGCGLFLALCNAVVRDIANILSVGITFLMLLTPILYQKPAEGVLAVMIKFNPIYYLIGGARDLIIMGEISDLLGFWISSGVSFFFFMFCLICFHLTETRITERV